MHLLIMFLIAILTILLLFVIKVFAKMYFRYSRRYGLIEKLPGPPRESRILGNTSMIMSPQTILPKFSKMHQEFGGIHRHWLAWIPIISLADAEYAEIFFTAKSLESKADAYKLFENMMGLGLITSNGSLWHERRRLITPAFHVSVLNSLCKIMVQNSVSLVKKLKEDHESSQVDVYTLMHLVALDNVCESTMGVKIDAVNNPNLDYIRALEDASQVTIESSSKPWNWVPWFKYTSLGRKLKKSLNTISEFTNAAIRRSRTRRELQKEDASCRGINDFKGKQEQALLDLLLDASKSSNTILSDQGLRDEVNTFMFAGHETTALTLSLTLFILGNNPEVQEKCHQEMDEIFYDSERKPTVDDLRAMKYLEKVIKESLRLYPSVPIIGRQVTDDTQFGDYTVPEGATVLLPIYCLHRNPKYFPNPEVFDPDHFTPENCAKRHRFAFVPFAAGARNCIGQKFAMMEMKVVLSYILRTFSMDSVYGLDKLEISTDTVMRSQKPLNVKFKLRHPSKI